jgi:hypothetical protein
MDALSDMFWDAAGFLSGGPSRARLSVPGVAAEGAIPGLLHGDRGFVS